MLLTSTGRTSSPLKALEVEVELEADAVAVGACRVTIGKAPDVVHAEDGENVVKTYTGLHIGGVAHGLAKGVGREEEYSVFATDLR